MLSILLLAIISIATMFSTTSLIGNGGLRATIMHVAWYVVGAVAIIVIMQFDSEQLWKITPYAYGLGLVLLVLVLFLYDEPTFFKNRGTKLVQVRSTDLPAVRSYEDSLYINVG